MTGYWTTNTCAMSTNTVFTNFDAQAMRKGLYTQLFFLFFIYFISQGLHTFIYKNNSSDQLSSSQMQQSSHLSMRQSMMNKQDKRKDLPWHQKKWNRTFSIIFSNHCVAIGVCLLFSPFAGSMVVAYLHFLAFIIYIVLQLKLMVLPAKIFRALLDVLNLALILIGVIGINYSTCNSANSCLAVNMGVLTAQTCGN